MFTCCLNKKVHFFFINIPKQLGNGFALRISISILDSGISDHIKFINLKSSSQVTWIPAVDA